MGIVSVIQKLMEPKNKITYYPKKVVYDGRSFYRTSTGDFRYTTLDTDKIPVMLFNREMHTCLCPAHYRWEYYNVTEGNLVPMCGCDCSKYLKLAHTRVEFPPAMGLEWDSMKMQYVDRFLTGKEKVASNYAHLKDVYKNADIADDVFFIAFNKNFTTDSYSIVLTVLDRVALENRSYFYYTRLPTKKVYFNYNCKTGRVLGANGCDLAEYFKDVHQLMPKKIYDFVSEEIRKDLRSQFGEKLSLVYSGNPSKELSSIVQFPYEPNITDVVEARRIEMDRDDPEVFNHVCERLGLDNHKVLRKNFAKDPLSLLACSGLSYYGFKDVNYIDGFISEGYSDFFLKVSHNDSCNRISMAEFYRSLILERGEGPAIRVLKKNVVEFREHNDVSILEDAASMWKRKKAVVKERNPELYEKILKDGLSKRCHDLLSEFIDELENPRIEFTYKKADRALEGTALGYEFKLPEDSVKLISIGRILHNCVGSYKDSVLSKECLIVYGELNGEIRLCIEVRDHKVIHQMRANYNADPEGMDLEAVEEWRKARRLSFHGNKF